jgi:hypothetical protein
MQQVSPDLFHRAVEKSLHHTPKEEPMQHAARHNRLRRAVVYAALATLLGAVSLTLSQCTQVGDSLTGVGRISHKPVSCKKQCDKDYNALKKQESALHKANKKACGSDAACKSAEEARHQAAIDALKAQRDACKANCHKQGAGSAG